MEKYDSFMQELEFVGGSVKPAGFGRNPEEIRKLLKFKPSKLFSQDVDRFKKEMRSNSHLSDSLHRKMNYFFKPYGQVVNVPQKGKKRFLPIPGDYMRFEDSEDFWENMTLLITKQKKENLRSFCNKIRGTDADGKTFYRYNSMKS